MKSVAAGAKSKEPSPRFVRKILRGIGPTVLLPLCRAGYLTSEHLNNLNAAREIIGRKRRFAIKNAKMLISMERTFLDAAEAAWKKKSHEVAITLFAVAIEQCLNSTFRQLLEHKGFCEEHVTSTIKSHNIEPKLTWLFHMHAGQKIPEHFVKKLTKIFEIRNSIVHYKAVTESFDSRTGSHSKIEHQISSLRPFHMRPLFERFNHICQEAIFENDPSTDLAMKLADKIFAHPNQT